jgi:hypothetical protein
MNYRIAWVKIEEGGGTVGFKPRLPGNELRLVQRYYNKSYRQEVAPGTASDFVGPLHQVVPVGFTAMGMAQAFPVLMRTTPTVVYYNPYTGGVNQVGGFNSGMAYTISVTNNLSPRQLGFITTTTGSVSSENVNVHYAASAEL